MFDLQFLPPESIASPPLRLLFSGPLHWQTFHSLTLQTIFESHLFYVTLPFTLPAHTAVILGTNINSPHPHHHPSIHHPKKNEPRNPLLHAPPQRRARPRPRPRSQTPRRLLDRRESPRAGSPGRVCAAGSEYGAGMFLTCWCAVLSCDVSVLEFKAGWFYDFVAELLGW